MRRLPLHRWQLLLLFVRWHYRFGAGASGAQDLRPSPLLTMGVVQRGCGAEGREGANIGRARRDPRMSEGDWGGGTERLEGADVGGVHCDVGLLLLKRVSASAGEVVSSHARTPRFGRVGGAGGLGGRAQALALALVLILAIHVAEKLGGRSERGWCRGRRRCEPPVER
jgi:hypothetical protein